MFHRSAKNCSWAVRSPPISTDCRATSASHARAMWRRPHALAGSTTSQISSAPPGANRAKSSAKSRCLPGPSRWWITRLLTTRWSGEGSEGSQSRSSNRNGRIAARSPNGASRAAVSRRIASEPSSPIIVAFG